MKLELASFPVEEMRFGPRTEYRDGVLSIDRDEVGNLVRSDPRLTDAEVHIVRPGDETRVIHVLDLIEPRCKVEGGTIFPGLLGPAKTVGSGLTHRLAGAAVIPTGEYHSSEGGLEVAREGVIDMSGPAVPYCLGATTHNLVITSRAALGATNAQYDDAIRLVSLKVAAYLAETTVGQEPPRRETFELGEVSADLPRVGYIYQLQSQGSLLQTFVYGHPADGMTPTLMHPNEFFDGAVVSGNHSSQPVPTYVHCDNPVIRELYRRHGQDVNFVGVILTEGHWQTTFLKERSACFAAKLAEMLKLNGVVLSQEGGGMSMVDQMLACRECEQRGISTVIISFEIAGNEQQDDMVLLFTVPEANAIVSTGNREQVVELPPMKTVLGGREIYDIRVVEGDEAGATVKANFRRIYGAINQAGSTRVRARDF